MIVCTLFTSMYYCTCQKAVVCFVDGGITHYIFPDHFISLFQISQSLSVLMFYSQFAAIAETAVSGIAGLSVLSVVNKVCNGRQVVKSA